MAVFRALIFTNLNTEKRADSPEPALTNLT